jgi:hypothetical protein
MVLGSYERTATKKYDRDCQRPALNSLGTGVFARILFSPAKVQGPQCNRFQSKVCPPHDLIHPYCVFDGDTPPARYFAFNFVT